MNKYLCIGLLLFTTQAYSQNLIELWRPLQRAKSAIVHRQIRVPREFEYSAMQVAKLDKRNDFSSSIIGNELYLNIEREIFANSLKDPVKIYGPYTYTKAFSRASSNPILVNEKYIDNWKHINTTGYYNGAHHLINKSTIKLIYSDLKAQGKPVRLNEMQANAPAIFHPLHGNTDYSRIFHNSERQYYEYKRFGMKVVIISAIEDIDRASIELGFQPYPQEYLEGILIESQLWCEYWGIEW